MQPLFVGFGRPARAREPQGLEIFSRAVSDYAGEDWARAKRRFASLLERKPNDRACQIFIERCEEYERHPPADGWAGEYIYTRK